MSDIKVIITGDASGLDKATKQATADLGKVAIAAQKTDSSLAKMGTGVSALGNVTKNAASQIGSLTGSLVSGGLITAITLAGVALFELGKKMFDVTDEQKRLNEVLNGAKDAYVKAVINVTNLREAFVQAENGIITKEKALKMFNSTMGKTVGTTKDFDEAERLFIANAGNYIKYTLLKAAANIALGKAAEAAFEVERNKQLGATKEGFFDMQNLAAILSGSRILSDAERALLRIGKAQKEESDFKKIANSLTQQYNSLGFTSVEVIEEETKAIKKRTVAEKEAIDTRTGIMLNKRTFSFLDDNTPQRTTGAGLTPTIVIRPNFDVQITPDQQQKVLDGMQALFDAEKLAAFQQRASEAVSNTIANIASDSISMATEAIGEAIAGNTEALPNLFEGLMKNVGSQIKELGKYLVEIGVKFLLTKKALEGLTKNPYTAIAVGAALQVLGSALVSSFNKKANKGFATGVRNLQEGGVYQVGERGPETIYLPRGSSVRPNNEVNAYGGGNMVFIPAVSLRGSDLVIAFNRASQSMSRNG